MNARVFVLILGIFVLGSASRALGNETPDGVAETRGDFTAFLDSLALNLRARVEARASDQRGARRAIEALRHVELAREEAQGNVNPQLTLAVLASDLEALV